MLGNVSDKMQSSQTESMPPIVDRTYQAKDFHSSLRTQRMRAAPRKEMKILEQDMQHLKDLSTLMPKKDEGRNEGVLFLKSTDKGQMNATSPTFSGILRGQIPQENAALAPSTPLITGGNNG